MISFVVYFDSERMIAHGRKWQKTFKKDEKSTFYERHTRSLRRKMKNKFPNEQPAFGNQRLGVTPNRWPTNFFLRFSLFFFVSLSWASREPLLCMMKKVLFTHFRVFSIIFDYANACLRIRSLVKIYNNHCLFSRWSQETHPSESQRDWETTERQNEHLHQWTRHNDTYLYEHVKVTKNW